MSKLKIELHSTKYSIIFTDPNVRFNKRGKKLLIIKHDHLIGYNAVGTPSKKVRSRLNKLLGYGSSTILVINISTSNVTFITNAMVRNRFNQPILCTTATHPCLRYLRIYKINNFQDTNIDFSDIAYIRGGIVIELSYDMHVRIEYSENVI